MPRKFQTGNISCSPSRISGLPAQYSALILRYLDLNMWLSTHYLSFSSFRNNCSFRDQSIKYLGNQTMAESSSQVATGKRFSFIVSGTWDVDREMTLSSLFHLKHQIGPISESYYDSSTSFKFLLKLFSF